jgi:L-asparagine transporter-like permease
MAITTIFVLTPLALIASIIYSYLFFSKYGLYNKIKNKMIRIILKTITYVIVIIFFTILLTTLGMALLIGIIGLPVLFILDIIGIILLIKKKITSRKLKKNNNIENGE